jgi:predicted transcriptional regulator
MAILLTAETEKLVEQRMKETGASSPDELVRVAVQTLGQIQGVAIEDLDQETQAAIGEGEAQYDRGEGIPLDQAFAQLRHKYLGE